MGVSSKPVAQIKPKYVILYPHIFSLRDWERFGCDFICERGYEVVILQCSELLGIDVDKLDRDYYHSIAGLISVKNVQELERIFCSLTKNDILLPIVNLINGADVFRLIAAYDLRYIMIDLFSVPQVTLPDHSVCWGNSEIFSFKLEAAIGCLGRLKVWAKVLINLKLNFLNLRSPFLLFKVGRNEGYLLNFYPPIGKMKTIQVENPEIGMPNSSLENTPEHEDEPYMVFLDEALPDHPDYEIHGFEPAVSKEEYYPKLVELFQKIKDECNLNVVIAAHPKSNLSKENSAKWLPDCTVIYGRTRSLVHNACLVMGHTSTAFGYAIIDRKPIIVLTNDGIENHIYLKGQIICMASWLGQKRLDIDAMLNAPFQIPNVNTLACANYEEFFLKTSDAQQGYLWQIILNEFEKRAVN